MTTAEVISVAELPEALDVAELTVCNGAGSDPDFINLTDLVAPGVTGIWTVNNNNVADPTNEVFTGAPVGMITYVFTPNNAMAPCENTPDQLVVTVRDCGCPSTAIGDPGDLCQEFGEFDLTQITITSEPGDWSISPTTGVDFSGTTINVGADAVPGIYTLTYELSGSAEPGCVLSASVDFTVFELLTAELEMTATACDTDQSGDITVVDLDELVLSGNMDGVWSSTDATIDPTTNQVDFNGLPQGNYTFTYSLTDNTPPCNPFAETVRVTVVDCSCPLLTLNPIPDQCNDGGNINLNTLLNQGAPQGSWSFDPPTITETGGIVNFGGTDANTYQVTYTVNAPVTGCTNEVTEPLLISSAPAATLTTNLVEVCNGTTLDVGLPTALNLNDFVTGDGGVWTVESGFNGGVIDDISNVDFLGVRADRYLFTYTTNTAVEPCEEIELVMEVSVRACNCPEILFLNPLPNICGRLEGTIDLMDFVTDFPVNGGTWDILTGPGPITVTPDGIVDVEEVTGGTYQFTFNYDMNNLPTG